MLVQVGIRPDNIMIAGNHQPESVYRPPSHITSTTSSSTEPRSSFYNSTAASSSIPASTSAFSRPSTSSRQSHSYHTSSSSSTTAAATTTTTTTTISSSSSSYTNSTPGGNTSSHHSIQPAHDSRQYSQYPADTTSSSSSSSSIQEPESRTMSPSGSRRSSQDSPPPPQPQPQSIQLRDIAHIIELSHDDPRLQPRSPGRRTRGTEARKKYEISSMPVTDVIEMVARLLTKITQTNDRTHQEMHRSIQNQDGSSGINGASSSILAFHGKNVPSISIHSYLSRIHKYCPTSYEVFLSLLVYFDRMTEKVNQNAADWRQARSRSGSTTAPPSSLNPPPQQASPASGNTSTAGESTISGLSVSNAYNMSHFFVVDSFNIHRLVIAGVTCASKFFSDIFYTNSRYAKVGGLPLAELNHLELQFLILNDFRLAVPVEELEAYGTMLVQFYAREAIANANLHGGLLPGGSSNGASHDGPGNGGTQPTGNSTE